MRTLWPDKDPAESLLVATFAYANELQAGESIASAAITCTVLSGTDPSPASMLVGSPQISGSNVLQNFSGGVDGVTYTLRCVATMSPTGRVLVRAATLPVRIC